MLLLASSSSRTSLWSWLNRSSQLKSRVQGSWLVSHCSLVLPRSPSLGGSSSSMMKTLRLLDIMREVVSGASRSVCGRKKGSERIFAEVGVLDVEQSATSREGGSREFG